jgi:hypothetical protein
LEIAGRNAFGAGLLGVQQTNVHRGAVTRGQVPGANLSGVDGYTVESILWCVEIAVGNWNGEWQ